MRKVPYMTDRFRIGVFSSVHGIRGEAKIFALTKVLELGSDM